MASIHVMSVKFEGDFLSSSQFISLRTAAKVFGPLQVAIDRAHLESIGRLHKNAKLSTDDYKDHIIWLGDSRENCRLFEVLATENDKGIIRRIMNIFSTAMNNSATHTYEEEKTTLRSDSNILARQVNSGYITPKKYNEYVAEMKAGASKAFIERAVAKELVQIGAVVASEAAGQSSIDLTSPIDKIPAVKLTRESATALRKYVGQKRLGAPLRVFGVFRGGDFLTKTGKFINTETGKTCILHFGDKNECNFLNGFSGQTISIVCCPINEYGCHDLLAGDLFYLAKD